MLDYPLHSNSHEKISVIGFDIKPERVEKMKNRIDPSEELESEAFDGTDIKFTCSLDDLREANFLL